MSALAGEWGLSLHLESARMRDDLSLYIGGETIFREKWLPGRADSEPVSWGAPDRTALTAQRVAPVCCGVPHALEGLASSIP